MWVFLAFVSAFFLGFYDIAKKKSLNGNAVLSVLFFNTIFGALIFLPFAIVSAVYPETVQGSIFNASLNAAEGILPPIHPL